MIGLGAKYLTAAGFGRYRITAASLGRDVMFAGWLSGRAWKAIMDAFGVDGTAVIAATNEYLNGIAASDKAKATALAGFINEDPMMVCSLGIQPQGVTMPFIGLKGDGAAYIDTNIVISAQDEIEIVVNYVYEDYIRYIFGAGDDSYGVGLTALATTPNLFTYFGGATITNTPIQRGIIKCIMNANSIKCYNNGSLIRDENITPVSFTARAIRFFGLKRNSAFDNDYHYKQSICSIAISRNGNYTHFFGPRKIGNNCGFYDFVKEGMIYKTSTNGTLSIEKAYPDGTPWTPPTP
jgi:hypothetical protein